MRLPDRHEVAADRAAEAALAVRPRSDSSPGRRGAPPRRRTAGGGPGRPLTNAEADWFEPRFGVDFSDVRILASASASTLEHGARAFTRGETITFAREPVPTSTADRRLLAHELAHVVQQRREPALSREVLRDAVGIKKVVIVPARKRIYVTLSDGRPFQLRLSSASAPLPVGGYEGVHTLGSSKDRVIDPNGLAPGVSEIDFTAYPPKGIPKWHDLADSTYVLEVSDAGSPAARRTPKTPQGKKKGGTGDGAKGRGAGVKGEGLGDRQGDTKGDKKGGDGDQGKGDQGKGDKPGGFPPESQAEKDAKVEALRKRLKGLPDVGGKPMTPEQLAKLAEMSAAELDDFVEFLKNTAVASDTPIDAAAELDKYLALSPADRELLRVNQELMGDAKAGPLPERVRIALDSSAAANVEVARQMKSLNKGLDDLAAIKDKVTHPEVKAALDATDLDPIDLEKLPAFREMMMLEGLLAGASTKSPEIEESAKELTKNIHGIRDYLLEEIAWLAAEIGTSYLVGLLFGPAGTAVAAGRALMLVHRLNKLRLFLERVEKAYATYQLIDSTVTKALGAWSTYQTFEAEFASGLADLAKLKELADDPNLDEETLEEAVDKVTELEDRLVEKMLTQLEDETGVGALLASFHIPANADEDALREILLNIPRGLRELAALTARYHASGRDIESVKLLTYKSVLVGSLLYPFVGYLAGVVGGRLSELRADRSLGERLLGVIGGAAGGKPYAPPRAATTRSRLAGARRAPRVRRPRPARKAKDADDAAKKRDTKEDEHPSRKKQHDDDAKDPSAVEWLEVMRKVKRLGGRYPHGIAERTLWSQGRKIASRHHKVTGQVSVGVGTVPGDWKLTIQRSPGGGEALETVKKGYRERWEAGRKAITSWAEGLEPDQRTIGPVRDRVRELFLKPYHYETLDTEYVASQGSRGRHRGVRITGRMEKSRTREIVVVDDLTGLHTGLTEADSIPIWWYKDPAWYLGYRSGLRLPSFGVTVPFPAEDTERHSIKVGSTTVTLGVPESNLIKPRRKLLRTDVVRDPSSQRRMRIALKRAGVPGLENYEIDHVKDLAFGGTNHTDNLWPLHRDKNSVGFGWTRDYRVLYLSPDRRTVMRGSLSRLPQKWFKIDGFSTKPANWGGRDGERP